MLTSEQYMRVYAKMLQDNIPDPFKYAKSMGEDELLDYIGEKPVKASLILSRKKNKHLKSLDIKEPNLYGKVGLIVEDNGVGKTFWGSMLKDTVVVSPRDFNNSLRGAPALVHIVETLYTEHVNNYVILPDCIDNIVTSLQEAIISALSDIIPSNCILIYNYVGFEWMFVYSKVFANAYKEYNPDKVSDYDILERLCTNTLDILEYEYFLTVLGNKYSTHSVYSLENLCKDMLFMLSGTPYDLTSDSYVKNNYISCKEVFDIVNRLCVIKEGVKIVRDLSVQTASI